jgi:hypothetical protein
MEPPAHVQNASYYNFRATSTRGQFAHGGRAAPQPFEHRPPCRVGQGVEGMIELAGPGSSANFQVRSWREHQDINIVMLATSLLPDQFLTA